MRRFSLTPTGPLPVIERVRGALSGRLRGGVSRGRADALTVARATPRSPVRAETARLTSASSSSR